MDQPRKRVSVPASGPPPENLGGARQEPGTARSVAAEATVEAAVPPPRPQPKAPASVVPAPVVPTFSVGSAQRNQGDLAYRLARALAARRRKG